MKWATRAHVHLDRVACIWLIKRFIDPAAEIVFLGRGEEKNVPADATPFGMPGVELGPPADQTMDTFVQNGPSFARFLRKYSLDDPALKMMNDVLASGMRHAVVPGDNGGESIEARVGVGLNAISVGLMVLAGDDNTIVGHSLPMYDALYLYCRTMLLLPTMANPPRLSSPDYASTLRSVFEDYVDLVKSPSAAH